MKKFFICILSIVLAFSFNFAAYAEEIEPEISEMFITQCNNFFSNKGYIAFSKNGEDVTSQFYNSNIEYYRSGNYAAIKESFLRDLSAFGWEGKAIQSRALVGQAFSEEFYALGQMQTFLPGKSYEMLYTISAVCRCDDVTKYVYNCSTPTMNVTWFSAGSYFEYDIVNLSLNETVLDNSRVYVTCSFQVDLQLVEDGVLIGHEVCPAHHKNFTYYPV